jgi:TRAP-type C4-dicarboxylate transport system permease small subunit
MKGSMKVLRISAIIMMGMTAAMNLFGGAGTYCAAFSNNIGYRMAFKALMDYRWLYQIVMVTTVLTGIAGVMALIKLIRGKPGVYRFTLIVLAIGTVLGGTQFFASLILRGAATPANVKFFINLATLLLFLSFLLPGIKDKVDFSQPMEKAEKDSTAGIVSILVGITALTIFAWAGPSHTYFGENWVYVLEIPLLVVGTTLTVGGFITVLRAMLNIFSEQVINQEQKI